MSLILDALRRADSERERGVVPGLYAQPVPAVAIEAAPRPRARPWHWIVIGAVAGLVAALAWYLAARETPRETARPAAATASAAPPAAAAVRAASGQAPVAPVASTAARANPTELQPAAEPAPWPQPDSRKVPERPPAAAPAPELAAAKAPAPAAAPAEPPIYTREQLPDNIRAELPPLAIGGSIYSASAANRSLIINGRIYRENDMLAADLLLEQIKLKAAVLRYKGYRFEVQF